MGYIFHLSLYGEVKYETCIERPPTAAFGQSGCGHPIFDLSSCRIAHCVGCFGCWTKTPGRCVIRNDAIKIYPVIAKSERVLYVSRVKYGGYDSPMKTMLERAIPV